MLKYKKVIALPLDARCSSSSALVKMTGSQGLTLSLQILLTPALLFLTVPIHIRGSQPYLHSDNSEMTTPASASYLTAYQTYLQGLGNSSKSNKNLFPCRFIMSSIHHQHLAFSQILSLTNTTPLSLNFLRPVSHHLFSLCNLSDKKHLTSLQRFLTAHRLICLYHRPLHACLASPSFLPLHFGFQHIHLLVIPETFEPHLWFYMALCYFSILNALLVTIFGKHQIFPLLPQTDSGLLSTLESQHLIHNTKSLVSVFVPNIVLCPPISDQIFLE